ncbi:MAG: ABC transporter substrate-binding protein, partial [Sphingomonadaceae bacterium]|nr:ABC transporter substrate-binding protein [Sphingomonadaceae bacterium]
APDATARAERLREAERALAELAPFIPIMRPIRWSLISSRIRGFRPNRYASHPLATLRERR